MKMQEVSKPPAFFHQEKGYSPESEYFSYVNPKNREKEPKKIRNMPNLTSSAKRDLRKDGYLPVEKAVESVNN